MPPLPMMSFAPDRRNHSPIHLLKRNEAVAVTAPMVKEPSGSTVAAGEQWKFAALSRGRSMGSASPCSQARM